MGRYTAAATAMGAREALESILSQRMAQREYADKQKQQDIENQQRQQQIGQGEARIGLDRDELGFRQEQYTSEAAQKAEAEAQKAEQVQGFLRSLAPEVQPMMQGRLLTGQSISQHDMEPPDQHTAHVQAEEEAKRKTGLQDYEDKERIQAKYRPQPTQAKPDRPMADVLAEYEAKKKIDAQYTGSRPSLGAERNTLNYFNRMLEAERNARKVEDQIGNRDTMVSEMPGVPGFLENFLRSPEGQQYTQAQRMFTEARLRKESGAAIPEGEFANDRRMNFRTSGDDPKTLAQKRAARVATMRGIGNAAGRALPEYYGEGTTLDDLLKEFADEAVPATGGAAEYDWVNGQLVPRK